MTSSIPNVKKAKKLNGFLIRKLRTGVFQKSQRRVGGYVYSIPLCILLKVSKK